MTYCKVKTARKHDDVMTKFFFLCRNVVPSDKRRITVSTHYRVSQICGERNFSSLQNVPEIKVGLIQLIFNLGLQSYIQDFD